MKRRSDYWRDRKRARESNESFYHVYKAVRAQQSASQAAYDDSGKDTTTAATGAHSGPHGSTDSK